MVVTEVVMNHLFAHVCCHPSTLEPRRNCQQWPWRISALQCDKPQCLFLLLLLMLPHNVLLHLCPRREAQGKRAGDKQCFLLQMNETNVHTRHPCHCLNTSFTSPGCMGRCTNCGVLYQTLSWTPHRGLSRWALMAFLHTSHWHVPSSPCQVALVCGKTLEGIPMWSHPPVAQAGQLWNF